MNTSAEKAEALVVDVSFSPDSLVITLTDGRTVSAPLSWFPRLVSASKRELKKWELIGGGIGIHWETLDEDISVASLLRPENFMRPPEEAKRPPSRPRRRIGRSKVSRAARG